MPWMRGNKDEHSKGRPCRVTKNGMHEWSTFEQKNEDDKNRPLKITRCKACGWLV